NPTDDYFIVSYYHKDPCVMQLPADWDVVAATITTPNGTGNATISTSAIPGAVQIAGDGTMSIAGYYQAEAGYKLILGDYPTGLYADGWQSGSVTIHAPDSGLRVDSVKYISAVYATMTNASTGATISWYLPTDPDTIDFASVASESHRITVDLSHSSC